MDERHGPDMEAEQGARSDSALAALRQPDGNTQDLSRRVAARAGRADLLTVAAAPAAAASLQIFPVAVGREGRSRACVDSSIAVASASAAESPFVEVAKVIPIH